MLITVAPRRPTNRRWIATSPATAVFLVSCFLLLLLAVPHGATAQQEPSEPSDNVAETEDTLFDKSACEPGLHKVEVSDNLQAPDIFNVRWKTTAAEEDIVLEVYREWAPLGADRFYQLVLDNYYNCGAFFRVVPGTFLYWTVFLSYADTLARQSCSNVLFLFFADSVYVFSIFLSLVDLLYDLQTL